MTILGVVSSLNSHTFASMSFTLLHPQYLTFLFAVSQKDHRCQLHFFLKIEKCQKTFLWLPHFVQFPFQGQLKRLSDLDLIVTMTKPMLVTCTTFCTWLPSSCASKLVVQQHGCSSRLRETFHPHISRSLNNQPSEPIGVAMIIKCKMYHASTCQIWSRLFINHH